MDSYYFNNNEGLGGFDSGGYDNQAILPLYSNWTRQTSFELTDQFKEIWNLKIEGFSIIDYYELSNFVIDRDHNIILSDNKDELTPEWGRTLLVDSEGRVQKILEMNHYILMSPILGANGHIFIATHNDNQENKLLNLTEDFSLIWECPIKGNPISRPILDSEWKIYICTFDERKSHLYCISPSGNIEWCKHFSSFICHDPVISRTGFIYLGIPKPNSFYCLDKKGNERWKIKLSPDMVSVPVIDMYGNIYINANKGLVAIQPDGKIKWEYIPKEGFVSTGPAMDKYGNIYFCLTSQHIVCLSPEGIERWVSPMKGVGGRAPIVTKNGYVCVVGSWPDRSIIQVFDNEGQLYWNHKVDEPCMAFALSPHNRLYLLTQNYDEENRSRGVYKLKYYWKLYAFQGISNRGGC